MLSFNTKLELDNSLKGGLYQDRQAQSKLQGRTKRKRAGVFAPLVSGLVLDIREVVSSIRRGSKVETDRIELIDPAAPTTFLIPTCCKG